MRSAWRALTDVKLGEISPPRALLRTLAHAFANVKFREPKSALVQRFRYFSNSPWRAFGIGKWTLVIGIVKFREPNFGVGSELRGGASAACRAASGLLHWALDWGCEIL